MDNKETKETVETADIPNAEAETVKTESEPKKAKKSKKNEELEKLNQENAQLKDQLLRQMAEFDNFRKRTAKEKETTFSDGVMKTLAPMLEVVDNFERALATPCADEAYQKGMEMLFAQLMSTLEKMGIKEIEALGQQLDPTLHCAVMQTQTEGAVSGEITQVLQKGYLLNDRVVRCAMVAVAQ